jgi:hypothetical protein
LGDNQPCKPLVTNLKASVLLILSKSRSDSCDAYVYDKIDQDRSILFLLWKPQEEVLDPLLVLLTFALLN